MNRYLHRISKAESDKCQACDVQQNGDSPPETVNHFIFECPAHEVARGELAAEIGIPHLQLSDLMTDTDRMKALVTFVNRTGRFNI